MVVIGLSQAQTIDLTNCNSCNSIPDPDCESRPGGGICVFDSVTFDLRCGCQDYKICSPEDGLCISVQPTIDCGVDNGGCTQDCIDGSPDECGCRPGFILLEDGVTCINQGNGVGKGNKYGWVKN